MKISIVTETFLPSTDGIVTRLCATIDWLLNQGHEIDIIAPDLGVYEYHGVAIHGVPARKLFFYRTKEFALPHPSVKKYLQNFNPDIVHVVNPAILGYSGVTYAKRLGYPLVASYHTNVTRYMDYYKLGLFKGIVWWYFKKLHNRAELNLCTSQTVREELISRDFKNVNLWKRGVDLNTFHPRLKNIEMRYRLSNGHPDKTILLYVGRLGAEKEIEKIKRVLDKSKDICLAIVGDGPYRSYLEEHFKDNNVVFTGFLYGHDLAEAYASADIFIFPSTTETLGLVLLEAMASGLPIVAAKSGPTCEQIEDGKTGQLYDPDHGADFEQKVMNLVSNPKLCETIGEAARLESINLGWSKAAEQLLGYYQSVLGQPDMSGVKRRII